MRKLRRREMIAVLAAAAGACGAWGGRKHLPGLREIFAPCRTYLIAGGDAAGRKDAILLLYVTEHGSKILVLPRDSRCEGNRKLNSMWNRLGPEGFTRLCAEIVGHPIDGYAEVPFDRLEPFLQKAFPDGLVVPVPYRLKRRDRAGGFEYDIAPGPAPSGKRRLTPGELTWFLRDRYSDPLKRGEAARVERWRIFLREARQELATPAGFVRLPSLASDACRRFRTDLSAREIVPLAAAQLRAPGFSVGYLPSRPVKIHGQWFVELDREGARRQARLARAGILVPDNCEVHVLNGTAVPGLANKTAGVLRSCFGVVCATGNAATAWEQQTTVDYAPAAMKPFAQAVGAEVGAGSVCPAEKVRGRPMIVVTLGQNRLKLVREVKGR